MILFSVSLCLFVIAGIFIFWTLDKQVLESHGPGPFLISILFILSALVNLSFSAQEYSEEERAILIDAAHYDTKTKELTWDNETVRFVLCGNTGKQEMSVPLVDTGEK